MNSGARPKTALERSINLSSRGYLAPLRSAPALKRMVLMAGIFIGLRVWGLKPLRAGRVATAKVPNPTSWTSLSRLSPSLTAASDGVHRPLRGRL